MDRRWNAHLASARRGDGYYSHAAIRAHGAESFDHEVLETVDTAGEAAQAEIWWIEHFGSCQQSRGYNITKGGQLGFHSRRTKKNLSELARAREAAMPPGARSRQAVERWARMPPEERSEMARRREAALDPKVKEEKSRKLSEHWKRVHAEFCANKHRPSMLVNLMPAHRPSTRRPGLRAVLLRPRHDTPVTAAPESTTRGPRSART